MGEDVLSVHGMRVPAEALHWSFARGGGPGGQHVNKTSTMVRLQVDLSALQGSAASVRRVRDRYGDVLVVVARSSRSQVRNRQAALVKAAALLQDAAQAGKVRRATKPSMASQERRLRSKRRASERKRERRRPAFD